MDKHRICKICNKRFANGKAMGGHMRSHLAKLPIPPKPQPPPVSNSPPKSPSSSSSLSNPSSKNHMQCYRSVNRELVCCLPKTNPVMYDRDSESESPRNPTRRRSKRRHRLVEQVIESPVPEPESVSLVTETLTVEDVAMCLMMLSRDKYTREGKEVKEEVIEVDESVEEEDDEDEEEDDSFFVTRARNKSQAKYRCETCNKEFRSYQALGGHRASHKNKKIKIEPDEEEDEEEEEEEEEEQEEGEGSGSGSGNGGGIVDVGVVPVGVIEQKSFACPFCDKVFESGQALGGHKKVHFSYLAIPTIPTIPKNPGKSVDKLFDLNLPAPEEDDDINYQVEHSAVSNAGISHPKM